MINDILFIIIGIKLDILNDWYLGLIITSMILNIISFGIKMFKIGKEGK